MTNEGEIGLDKAFESSTHSSLLGNQIVKRWIFSFFCFFCLFFTKAAISQTLNIPITPQPDVSHFIDVSQSRDLEAIKLIAPEQWQPNYSPQQSSGYSSDHHWFKFRFTNPDTEIWQGLIEIRYPLLDYVDIYLEFPGAPVQRFILGDQFEFKERPINHRNFLVPLDLFPDESVEVFIKVKTSSSMQLPIQIWNNVEFHNKYERTNLGFGLYLGLMLSMAIYNIFIYFSVRERSYIYYVAFALVSCLFFFTYYGYAYQYLWPNLPDWNRISLALLLWAVVLASSRFSMTFLQFENRMPRTYLLFKLVCALSMLGMVASFVIPYSINMQIAIAVGVAINIVSILISLIRWAQGLVFARYFSLAWMMFMSGGVLLALATYGVIPLNTFTRNAMMIGSGFEVFLLSLALIERLNIERRKRQEAQDRALEIHRNSTLDLEHRVNERTLALQDALSQLELTSHTDSLTGVYNRRYLDEALDREFHRCARFHHPISIIIFDIDHFKRFNDTFGHIAGDQCLVHVAQIISKQVNRATDTFARFGGEEFVIVLPETLIGKAASFAEKIRFEIERSNFDVEGSKQKLTISAGVSSIIPEAPFDSNALIEKADSALYQAKDKGRNCVQESF
ncbi:GGDEF domain-containing protein [Alginatibacterium sediminis]|uniref:diguanylate cyclase n=1 Tax=Alginatibacterium sediminis TaxID=2164068 RepID=A0A420ECY7_9ALTE|nr:diguanylate cyclase [Alginatibacterium sediminis]RKF18567.1 GGDEF domain-containing protein [Alginatibacterium sediminis]